LEFPFKQCQVRALDVDLHERSLHNLARKKLSKKFATTLIVTLLGAMA
jgi:hypothetical protein